MRMKHLDHLKNIAISACKLSRKSKMALSKPEHDLVDSEAKFGFRQACDNS
jgi:hypothetical protein